MDGRKFVCMSILVALLFSFTVHAAEKEAGRTVDWKTCVLEALKHNNDIKSAQEDIRQSEASLVISRSARLPSVSASAGVSESKSYLDDRGDGYSYGVSGSQLVYDFGRSGADIGKSEQGLTVSELKYQSKSADVRRRLRQEFISLMRAQELTGLSAGILKRREQSTKLIRLRYEAGREHKGALLTAEAKEAEARVDRVQAERALVLAQKRLIADMGWPPDSTVSVTGEMMPAQPPREEPEFRKIAESTPLLRQYAAQTEISRLDVDSANAAMLPSVKAQAGISRSDSSWPPGQEGWSAGLSLSVPVISGGSQVAQRRKAASALRGAEADEQGAYNSVLLDLRTKWTDYINAMDELTVRRKYLDATSERSRISAAQYATGLIGFDSWIIIEDDSVGAENAMLSAKAAALNAEADWIYANGGTLENEEK